MEPFKNSATDTKITLKPLYENVMVDGIKRCGQIKKSEEGYISFINREQEVVKDLEKGSFSAMAGPVCRLERVEKLVGIQIIRQLGKSKFLDYFLYKGQI